MDASTLESLIRSLEIRSDSLGFWLEVWIACVVVGLLIEILVVALEHLHKLESRTWKNLCIKLIGPVLIAVGVAGELAIEVKAEKVESDLRNANRLLVALINKQAEEANERASKADERAFKNEEQAARLRAIAEHERLARIEIEEKVAWRRLTKKQQIEIASSLSGFSEIKGIVWFLAGDVEGGNFARDIVSALRLAKWQVVGPGSFVEVVGVVSNSPAPEVGVRVVSTEDALSIKASDILLRNLNALGFDCVKSTRTEKRRGPAIWVEIKSRPEGPQGEAKRRHHNRPKK